MSSIKEARKQVVKSNSPLRHHSLNQLTIKVGNQGEKRLNNQYPPSISENTNLNLESNHIEIARKILDVDLPLNGHYLEKILPVMIEIASQRILEEETKQSSIPTRIFRIATDIQRIYRLSQREKLHLQMVDHQKFAVEGEDNLFTVPTYLDHIKYPHVFNQLGYLNTLNRIIEPKSRKLHLSLYKSIISNLTSCDFSLPYSDQIIERVKVYAFVMADLALAIYPDPSDEKSNTYRLDIMFLKLLSEIKAPLLKK
ncbi:MAG TPA: hypothetical protein VIK81_04630 [Patescibacteria group bacterium]